MAEKKGSNSAKLVKIIIAVIVVALIAYFIIAKMGGSKEMEKSVAGEDQLQELVGKIGTGDDLDKDWSYVTGYFYGTQMLNDLAQTPDIESIDRAEVVQAITDLLNGSDTRLSREEVDALVQGRIAQEQEKSAERAGENKVAGDAFVASYAQEEGVLKTPEGTLYKVITSGDESGEVVGSVNAASVLYEGKKIDGTVFDGTAANNNQPVQFVTQGLIPGVGSALAQMRKGDKWEIVVPVELGYQLQVQPNGPIQPNEALIFEIEVVDVLTPKAPETAPEAATQEATPAEEN